MTRTSERGSALLGVAAALSLLSVFALSLSELSLNKQYTAIQEQSYYQARSIAQAGLEYGLGKVYAGQSPVLPEPGLNFSTGRFTIDQNGRQLTINAYSGESFAQDQVLIPTEGDCLTINMEPAFLNEVATSIINIELLKECRADVTITMARLIWSSAQTTPTPEPGVICHIPPGNPNNAHTLNVGLSAVQAHLNHGDRLGDCNAAVIPPVPSKVVAFRLDSSTLYSDAIGNSSNTWIDLVNATISNNSVHRISSLDFNAPIQGAVNVSLELQLSDQSSVSASHVFLPEDANQDYDSCSDNDPNKVRICHYPNGTGKKKKVGRTICVNQYAVAALQEHGDTVGACR